VDRWPKREHYHLLLSPYDRHLGLELVTVEPDRIAARMPVNDHLKQPYGLVHGGVYASIAESLASIGTALAVFEEGASALGLANQTSFLRPATGGELLAEATPLHKGRTTWVWDVSCRDGEGRLCAVSRMTIAVRPNEGRLSPHLAGAQPG
jgi:1,4-dihydroxy-2-naphthoyl-CoA hydrolase